MEDKLEGKEAEDDTMDRIMVHFVKNLDVDDILDSCLAKELITANDLSRINKTIKDGENNAAIRDLMLRIKRSAPGYLSTFYKIVQGSKSRFLAPYIKEEYAKQLEARGKPVVMKSVSHFTKRLTPMDPPNNPSLVGDGKWPFEMVKLVENEVLNPPSEDLTDASGLPSYQMKSSPRGLGIIVSNVIFTCGMMNRAGTGRDATALQRLFTHLGFHTNRYDNLTGTQFRRVFNEAAAIDHKNFDCLLVAILTHGTKGRLLGTDGELISVEDITKLFNGYRCPSLIGKPKIFIIDSCRGNSKDYGVELETAERDDDLKKIDHAKAIEEQFDSIKATKEQSDSIKATEEQSDSIKAKANVEKVEKVDSGTIAVEADYLLAYATIPGYVSWRNSKNGSWFVCALVNVFLEMADKEHLMDMLTEVNRRVTEEFESTAQKYKQVPEPVSRLRKKLYFRPGKYS